MPVRSLLGNRNHDDPGTDGSEAPGFALENIVANHPEPALLVDAAAKVVAANQSGAHLAAALDKDAIPGLAARIAEVSKTGLPAVDRTEIRAKGGDRTFDITFIPDGSPPADSVALLTHDVTSDRNLTNALVASRALFKDLVGCSSDFAWETKADGTFGFVSPRGALGFTARELEGRAARGLLDADREQPDKLPFEAKVAVDDIEMWVRQVDGSLACLEVSSVPVLDDDGRWLGARGVCRDVTEARERDMALESARNREQLQARIIDTMRNEIDTRRMLEVAAESIAESVDAVHCWIYMRQEDGSLDLAADCGGLKDAPEPVDVVTAFERSPEAFSMYQTFNEGSAPVLVIPTLSHDVVNGALCVDWAGRSDQFDEDQREMLAGISGHIGIAIEQIANVLKLERISRTDELTGLLNRRAFFEEVTRRYKHLGRMKRQGALLYVDLDNFKQVNDVHGHQRGDDALKSLSGMLRDSRIGDIPARLGGDEFALWLEEVDEPAAVTKAEKLLEASHVLREYSGSAERPLGISIGIAVSDGEIKETVPELVARADSAMYQAKRGGKGDYAITQLGVADSPEPALESPPDSSQASSQAS